MCVIGVEQCVHCSGKVASQFSKSGIGISGLARSSSQFDLPRAFSAVLPQLRACLRRGLIVLFIGFHEWSNKLSALLALLLGAASWSTALNRKRLNTYASTPHTIVGPQCDLGRSVYRLCQPPGLRRSA